MRTNNCDTRIQFLDALDEMAEADTASTDALQTERNLHHWLAVVVHTRDLLCGLSVGECSNLPHGQVSWNLEGELMGGFHVVDLAKVRVLIVPLFENILKAHGMKVREETPYQRPKLSERRSAARHMPEGGKAAVEVGAVTHGAVHCSACLGVSGRFMLLVALSNQCVRGPAKRTDGELEAKARSSGAK